MKNKYLSTIGAAVQTAHSRTATAYRAQALLYAARGYEFTVNLPDIAQLLNTGSWQNSFKTSNIASNLLSPNPATQSVALPYDLINTEGQMATATLHLYDFSGHVVYTQTLQGSGTHNINLSNFAQGLYVYDLSNDNHTWIRGKLIITQ